MPIFEFICADCGEPFEELVRSASAVDEVTCPNCHSEQVRKQISTFAARVTGKSSSSFTTSAPSCSTGSV
jgi:putative FmdB family regulatory protein